MYDREAYRVILFKGTTRTRPRLASPQRHRAFVTINVDFIIIVHPNRILSSSYNYDESTNVTIHCSFNSPFQDMYNLEDRPLDILSGLIDVL
jgi:hypothetical protein